MQPMLLTRMSICVSVMLQYCVRTAKCIIRIFFTILWPQNSCFLRSAPYFSIATAELNTGEGLVLKSGDLMPIVECLKA